MPGEAVDAVQINLGMDRAEAEVRLTDEAEATDLAAALADRLDDKFVGAYLADGGVDSDGTSPSPTPAPGPDPATSESSDLESPAGLVVAVTDQAAADVVRAAGAIPKIYDSEKPTPDEVDTEVARLADTMPSSTVVAWSVDLVSDTLMLTVTGTGTDRATRDFAKAAGIAVRRPVGLEIVDVGASPSALYGGQAIDGSDRTICTAGFLTRDRKGKYAMLTAGHCANKRPVFGQSGRVIGKTLGYRFPGQDFALVSVDNPRYWKPQGGVMDWSRPRDIAGRTTPPVGATVCKSGRTSRTTCGPILRYGVTVNYGKFGKVKGLVEARLCVRPGDSGGPVWSGRFAQGVISGSMLNDGKCLPGTRARAFYQPIAPALAMYQVSLY